MTIAGFCRQLRELAQRELNTAADLKEWHAAARELEASLSADLADRVPHFVWHYLADVDIRFRDEVYREDQEQRLKVALKELGDG